MMFSQREAHSIIIVKVKKFVLITEKNEIVLELIRLEKRIWNSKYSSIH